MFTTDLNKFCKYCDQKEMNTTKLFLLMQDVHMYYIARIICWMCTSVCSSITLFVPPVKRMPGKLYTHYSQYHRMHKWNVVQFHVLLHKLWHQILWHHTYHVINWQADWSTIFTAAADCPSQSTAPLDLLGSRGHAARRAPRRGTTGEMPLHDVNVTRRHDLWTRPPGLDVSTPCYARPCTQTSATWNTQ